MKYVYMLRAGGRYYKIGVAVNVTNRVSTLQTSNPTRIDVVMTRLVDDAYKVEHELHGALEAMKLDGGKEWFDLTPDQALMLAIELNRYPEIDMTHQITLRETMAQHERFQKAIDLKLDRVLAMDEEYMKARAAERLAAAQLAELQELAKEQPISDDDLLGKALAVFKENEGRASTSLLQRKLSIGYGRAARIMDKLEARQLITAFDGPHARQIIVSTAEELVS